METETAFIGAPGCLASVDCQKGRGARLGSAAIECPTCAQMERKAHSGMNRKHIKCVHTEARVDAIFSFKVILKFNLLIFNIIVAAMFSPNVYVIFVVVAVDIYFVSNIAI